MRQRHEVPRRILLGLCAMLLMSVGVAAQQDQGHQHDHDVVMPEVELPQTPASEKATDAGTPHFELLELSLNFLGAFGTSTERGEELARLDAGHHDPRTRGFTFQNLELSMKGAVDPYFRLETYLIYFVDPVDGESKFEVEEAFATTSSLPHGLELELGYFLTEFGLINPQHPHEWDWLDQPVILSRIFGADGMRAGGFRMSWQPNAESEQILHFGMQNANGETMTSFVANDEVFEERAIGGRAFQQRDVRSLEDFVYLGRWETAFATGKESMLQLGVSGLHGPNATGENGETWALGAFFRWRSQSEHAEHGQPSLELQGEYLYRSYDADSFQAPGPPAVSVPSERLADHGFYLQGLWGFARSWAVGLRCEYATGSGENVDADTGSVQRRNADPFRSDRIRISPLLSYRPSQSSRLRLQYDYDDSKHLNGGSGDTAHSVWFGVEVMIGEHSGHDH